MLDLAIIADDLTGALDAAAPFAGRGIGTAVALNAGAISQALATGARILSVSTDSREVSPGEATRAVGEVLARLPVGTPLFKKIDSRVKGNIAAELEALDFQSCLVVPAIPAFGRVTRGGRLEGFGVAEPIDIAARLGPHADRTTIPDIATQGDIEQFLDAHFDLLVGARSLAEAVATRMAPGAAQPAPDVGGGIAFCLIGSTDPITLEQLEHLRRSGAPSSILAPNGGGPKTLPALSDLNIIQAVPGPEQVPGSTVAASLAQTLQRLAPPPGSLLVLSGGATAQVILEALGIDVLTLLGEAQPGLPMAEGGGLTVITKSGGFGDPNCLARLLAPYVNIESQMNAHVG